MLKRFLKKNCKRQIKQEFRIEKVIKKKGDKLYTKWKGCGNSLNSWTDKKKLLHKMSYYSEPDSYGRNNIKIALDLSD